MAAAAPFPLDGMWTGDLVVEWLRGLGVETVTGVPLRRGPVWPHRVDRLGLVTSTPGGRGRAELDEAVDAWPGFQLAYRGRQRDESDRDAEALSRVADRLIIGVRPPLTVVPGAGRVRLLELVRSGSGPAPIGPYRTPGNGPPGPAPTSATSSKGSEHHVDRCRHHHPDRARGAPTRSASRRGTPSPKAP